MSTQIILTKVPTDFGDVFDQLPIGQILLATDNWPMKNRSEFTSQDRTWTLIIDPDMGSADDGYGWMLGNDSYQWMQVQILNNVLDNGLPTHLYNRKVKKEDLLWETYTSTSWQDGQWPLPNRARGLPLYRELSAYCASLARPPLRL